MKLQNKIIYDDRIAFLWSKVLEGSPKAWEELYNIMTIPGLIAAARYLKDSPFEAADVLHDVLSRIWIQREELKRKEIRNVKGFIYKIMYNEFKSKGRNKANRDSLLQESGLSSLPDTCEQANLFDDAFIQACINLIPNQQDRTFIKLYVQGYKPREIASEFKVEPSYVSRRIFKAKKSLRIYLLKNGMRG